MNIHFNICVPIYNLENKYIERCLLSIKHQTYIDFICSIVDDGSTSIDDNLIKTIIADDKRFIYNKTLNYGLSQARNNALTFINEHQKLNPKEENNTYVWFIDGDDYIDLDSLNKIKDAIVKNKKPNMVRIQYYEISDKQKIVYARIHYKNKAYICETSWSTIFNKNFLIKNNFWHIPKLLHEDISFFLITSCLSQERKICYLNETLYYYVILRDSSITKSSKEKRLDYFYNVFLNIIKAFYIIKKSKQKSINWQNFKQFYCLLDFFNEENIFSISLISKRYEILYVYFEVIKIYKCLEKYFWTKKQKVFFSKIKYVIKNPFLILKKAKNILYKIKKCFFN